MRTMHLMNLFLFMLLFVLSGLNGCALDGPVDNTTIITSTPSGTIDGKIYKAKKDVEMYDKILKEQQRQRRELQKKIENTSVMDHVSRAVSGVEAVVTMDSSKIIADDHVKLDILDRRIRESKRNLDYSKKKLEDLEKQQEGGEGGGGSC